MKCQLQASQKYTLRVLFFAGLLFSLMGSSVNSFADCSVDGIKRRIIQEMQHSNRSAIQRYHQYSGKFNKLIEDFLNTRNRESCEAHAFKFDAAILQFKQDIVEHPEFKHLREPLLNKLCQDLLALVHIIRRYNKSGVGMALSFINDLKSYEHLLSSEIKNKYDKLTLFSSICHRLQA